MNLMEMYPDFWAASPEFEALQAALGPEADALKAAEADVVSQLCVDTATWGLALWERALGLQGISNASDEDRRSRLRSRLRGTGVTTRDAVRSVAEAFSGGDVEITENPGACAVEIRFVGRLGVPPNMKDLTATLMQIMPAHIKFDMIYKFNTWAKVGKLTWAQAGAYTWAQLKEADV